MHSTSVAIFLAVSPVTVVKQVTTCSKISHELPEKRSFPLSLFPYSCVFQHSAGLRAGVVITYLLTDERL